MFPSNELTWACLVGLMSNWMLFLSPFLVPGAFGFEPFSPQLRIYSQIFYLTLAHISLWCQNYNLGLYLIDLILWKLWGTPPSLTIDIQLNTHSHMGVEIGCIGHGNTWVIVLRTWSLSKCAMIDLNISDDMREPKHELQPRKYCYKRIKAAFQLSLTLINRNIHQYTDSYRRSNDSHPLTLFMMFSVVYELI